ncbi:MAG: hypothetical protein KF841_04020 [Phycisphaerae bacterium]|nr:hypothetical protein [Phycisphaerae bacterium]
MTNPSSPMTAAQTTGCVQPLNAADRLMLVAHEGMRRLGHPGFQCQTHVWLDGRLDVGKFRSALASLERQYPVITSRLARDRRGIPYWSAHAGPVKFTELDESSDEQATVWRTGERLFAEPLDPDRHPPIEFHLLHLPDGRDVLLLRFSHVLMDGKGPEFALSEISRLHAEESASTIPAMPCAHDELAEHLSRIGRRRRFSAAMQVVRSQIKLPIRSGVLARGDVSQWCHGPLRILVREMDEARTRAAIDRVRRLCGFANLSPAVLASVFRAIRAFTDKPIGRRTGFQTDVPLNLRAPGKIHPVFRNYMSFIRMCARADELEDRDALTRSLNAYMRDQIRRGVDIGTAQMMSLMAPMEKLLARHLVDRMRKDPISLGFGFLGPVLAGLESFCGRRVDRLYSLNASISPPGMVLQVGQFRGRMSLAMTYIEEKVPDELANRFAEFIMDDLTT